MYFQARSASTQVSMDELMLSREDIWLFQQFFARKFREVSRAGRRDSLLAKLREIEVSIVLTFEERMRGREALLLKDLMADIVSRVLNVGDGLRIKYSRVIDSYKFVNIEPDPSKLEEARALDLPSPGDAEHVASAATYAQQEGVEVAFVSLDYKDVISKSYELQKKLGICCSDPLYAIYCFVD